MNTFKLGKLPRRFHPHTLALADYLTPQLPAPRGWINWEQAVRVPWEMMLNDSLGDCVWAAGGHSIMVWSANAGIIFVPTDSEILVGYESTGYTPSDPSTDQGTVITQMLAYWRDTGLAGHKIAGWAEFDPTNRTHFKQAIQLFGCAFIGVQIRQSDMDATNAGQPWTPHTDAVIGGHGVTVAGYGATGVWLVTWGQLQYATWTWIEQNCDEAYGICTSDFIAAQGRSPSGFNLSQLQQDLIALKWQPA